MSRKLIIDSSETGHSEIDYSSLTQRQIDSRIRKYEKKYGMTLLEYRERHSCTEASPSEEDDLWDWDCLLAERGERPNRRT